MTLKEIRKNAPEGATHYRDYTGQYFKIINSDWHLWNGFDWIPCQKFRCYLEPL